MPNMNTRSKQIVLDVELQDIENQSCEETSIPIPDRKWSKKKKTTVIPEYEQHEGPIDAIFDDCETATDIFLKLLGKSIDDIIYQSNLYATQQNKPLNLTTAFFYGNKFYDVLSSATIMESLLEQQF